MTIPCSRRGVERSHPPDLPSTTRASDEERDEVVQALVQHHVDGRLSTAEFEERAALAVGATTLGDLEKPLMDLPSLAPPDRHIEVASRIIPLLLVAAFIAAVVVTHGRAVFALLWVGVILTVIRRRGPWRRPGHWQHAAP